MKYRLITFFWTQRKPLLLLGLLLSIGYWNCLPETLFNDPRSTVLYDRDGELLGARIAADGQWRFPHNTAVPEKFKHCLVQFEDRQFYDHAGFSLRGFGRAFLQNLEARRVVSGGSTISMQVIRLSRKGKSRNLWEKLVELIQATRMEWRYNKSQILAYWASNAPYGGNVVGLDAASWRYYGGPPTLLSWAESATLAVLPNAPSLIYPGKNQHRLLAKRNRLLHRLLEVDLLDSIGYQLALVEPLPQAPHPLPDLAPHLMSRFQTGALRGNPLKSSLDASLQKQVQQSLAFHQARLAENKIYNAGALILDVHSGEVLAYVGNLALNDPAHGGDVDVIRAPRSTGSILKPFLYGGMLEEGMLTPHQLVPDVPTQMGGYSPKNYTQNYDGAVPAHRALARSLNVPAVLLLRDYGVARFHLQLRKMGMTTLQHGPDHYGLSLILGGAEATLWDLAAMYGQMANTLNQYPRAVARLEPKVLLREESNEEPIGQAPLSAGVVWHTFQAMLEVARPEEDSNWQAFGSARKVAWKTGTSFGFRDAWAVGVTPNHVVAVWVGNADGEGRPGLVGVEAAAPIMFHLFGHLPPSQWFDPPHDDMQEVALCAESGYRASSICPKTNQVAVPLPSLDTRACPFHRWVHLDAAGKHQVNSHCMNTNEMQHRAWFVLPPVMEWYYRFNHPRYQPLPAFLPGCSSTKGERTMSILYPKRPSRIYVPRQLDGTRSKTVFEITHRTPEAVVYWHLDEVFLGQTQDLHQMELNPPPGKHRLTLVDEQGNAMSQTFEVIAQNNS